MVIHSWHSLTFIEKHSVYSSLEPTSHLLAPHQKSDWMSTNFRCYDEGFKNTVPDYLEFQIYWSGSFYTNKYGTGYYDSISKELRLREFTISDTI